MSYDTKMVLDVISDFINSPFPRADQIIEHGKGIIVGDIRILPLQVRHSAKGALMFLIEADGKRLLYTGDFNHIDTACYSLLGKVDVLLCEGTNIGALNGITEKDVESKATQIMRETKEQVFVLCSTTNIERVRKIEMACRKSGRTMAYDPFMKAILDRVAHALIVEPVGFIPHYIDAKKTPRSHKYLISDIQTISSAETLAKLTNLTFMIRQTMSDFLVRLDKIKPLDGSTLIYSMWRGYENTASTKKFLDLCRSLGMKIEYLHASGHAYWELLEAAIHRLNPSVLIPIHTESADTFKEIHNNVVLLDDGEILSI